MGMMTSDFFWVLRDKLFLLEAIYRVRVPKTEVAARIVLGANQNFLHRQFCFALRKSYLNSLVCQKLKNNRGKVGLQDSLLYSCT